MTSTLTGRRALLVHREVGAFDDDVDDRWTAFSRLGDRLVCVREVNGQSLMMKYCRMIAQKTSWGDAVEFAAEPRASAPGKAAAHDA